MRLRQGEAGLDDRYLVERLGPPERPRLLLRGDPQGSGRQLLRAGLGLRHRRPGGRSPQEERGRPDRGDGDARRALSALEVGVLSSDVRPLEFTRQLAEESVQRKAVQYDADGDSHYDSASALIKSLRGSDPDAALYWLARMLEGGEDVRFLTRRLVILASEDVGNADPMALVVATSAWQACEFVGLPECQLTLAQAVTYLATAPKSNAATVAIGEARGETIYAAVDMAMDKVERQITRHKEKLSGHRPKRPKGQ